MAVNLTNADNALKSVYLDVITEQLNNSVSPFLAAIEKSTEDVWGKDVKKLVVCGRNGGIGAGTEDGALPLASGNKYAQLTTTLKNLYGVIEISDKALRASENNSGAFVSLLNAEMDGLIKASTFNFGRMLFGDGTGKITNVVASLDNTIIVESIKNLFEGMVIDVYQKNGISVVKGATVESVDAANSTLYLNKNITTEIVDGYIVMQGSQNNEITGLKKLFNQNDYMIYGLDKTGQAWLNPIVKAVNGKISEQTIQTMLDDIEESSGSRTNFIICSWGVRRALINLLSANKRVVDTMELKGGFNAISYNGIPIVVDRFCPSGTMYFLNTNDFTLHQLCDWQWLEGDDGRVLKQIPGKPVYTATLVKYAELLCSRPCGQGMLTGITEE